MKTNVAKGLRLTPQLLKPSDQEAADGGLLFSTAAAVVVSHSNVKTGRRADVTGVVGGDDAALRRQIVFKRVEALAGSQTFRYFFRALPFAVNVTLRPPIRSGVPPLQLPAPWCDLSCRFGEFTSFTLNTQRGRVSSHRLLENFASLQQRQRRLL